MPVNARSAIAKGKDLEKRSELDKLGNKVAATYYLVKIYFLTSCSESSRSMIRCTNRNLKSMSDTISLRSYATISEVGFEVCFQSL